MDVTKSCQRCHPLKRLKREMAIDGRVHRQDEGREIDMETCLVSAKKIATLLLEMGAEAVQQHRQIRDM